MTHASHDHHETATVHRADLTDPHDLDHEAIVEDAHAGHGPVGGHGDHIDIFRRRFWVSLVLSIPVIIYSPMVQD